MTRPVCTQYFNSIDHRHVTSYSQDQVPHMFNNKRVHKQREIDSEGPCTANKLRLCNGIVSNRKAIICMNAKCIFEIS